jgi:hypothetical protein
MVRPGRPVLAGCAAGRARAACRMQVLYDAFGSEGLPVTFFRR